MRCILVKTWHYLKAKKLLSILFYYSSSLCSTALRPPCSYHFAKFLPDLSISFFHLHTANSKSSESGSIHFLVRMIGIVWVHAHVPGQLL
mmetsp:Transcript_7869/g.15428  ORF Transcript_7869/g.15428 Transcript_7869/m.15428 type:complete len:90 (-) Transcript_7869:883-1152(-)